MSRPYYKHRGDAGDELNPELLGLRKKSVRNSVPRFVRKYAVIKGRISRQRRERQNISESSSRCARAQKA